MYEAKTNLSKLVKHVAAGDEVVLTSGGKPVAKLVPYTRPEKPRKPGQLTGKIKIKRGFDDLPPGFDEAFGR